MSNDELRTLEGELDALSIPSPLDGAGAGVAVTGSITPAPSSSPQKVQLVTVLVNNQAYLAWVLSNTSRAMGRAAVDMKPLNPLKVPLIAMARFMAHPNTWRLLVGMLAQIPDVTFDEHWADFRSLIDQVGE